MNRFLLSVFAACLACLAHAGAVAQQQAPALQIMTQRRDADGKVLKETVAFDPARTAVVVVDMWDKHWCATYTERVANLVPRMNQSLDAARALGFQVVFAPSDVVAFYKDAPQRQLMEAVPQHPAPRRRNVRLHRRRDRPISASAGRPGRARIRPAGLGNSPD